MTAKRVHYKQTNKSFPLQTVKKNQSCYFIAVEIDNEVVKEAAKKIKKVPLIDILNSVFIIYFSRLYNNGAFNVDYTYIFPDHLTTPLRPFLFSETPLNTNFLNSLTGKELIQKLIKAKTNAFNNKVLSLGAEERSLLLKKKTLQKAGHKNKHIPFRIRCTKGSQ